MKKDVLLPIAAIALAPVGAYAAVSTAEVSKDNTIATKDGTLEYSLIPGTYTVNVQKAGVNISAADGVLSSGAGDVAVSDGKATTTIVVAKQGTITVKAAADGAVVSITVNASNYKNLADDLSKELALVSQDIESINTSTDEAKAEKQKAVDAYTKVTGKIKTLSETTDSDYSAWETASTTTKNEISSATANLKGTIADAKSAANADAKSALTTASNYVNTQITTLNKTIEADSEYTKADETVATELKVLSDLKDALDNEAKADSPNANKSFSETVTAVPSDADAFNKAVDAQVKKVDDAITAAEEVNTDAYNESTANVKAAKTAYDDALAALKAALTPAENYANLYAAAAQELTSQYDAIASVEAKVKADKQNAVDTKKGYATELTDIQDEIKAIQEKYEKQHTTLESAYESAVERTVTALQIDLDSYVDRLGDAAKDETDSHRYDKTIAEIRADIDALSAYIVGELQAVNTSDGQASYTKDATELNKRNSAISGMLAELSKATDKYETYLTALETIAGVQNELEAVTKHLEENKSKKDAEYVSNKYFSDRVTLAQKKIDALTANAKDRYGKSSVTSVTTSTSPSVVSATYDMKNITTITVFDEIATIQTDADVALKKYNNLFDKKAEFDAAVTDAEAVLDGANTDVIYGYATDTENTKTYAAELNELKAQRDEFAKNLTTAKTKTTGDDHKKYLDDLDLTKNESLLTAITADGYTKDETAFNNAALYTSAIVSIEEAKAKIATEQTAIDEYTKAGRKTYGNAWETSDGTAGDLQKEVKELQEKLGAISQGLNDKFYTNGSLKTSEVEANPAASLSSVNKIQEEIDALAKDVEKLKANAEKVADTYAAVLAAQEELTESLKAAQTSLYKVTLEYSSVSSDKGDYDKKKADISKEITKLQSEIADAADAETIVAYRATTEADGTTTTGLDDKIAAIVKEVSEFSTQVGEWNTNDANKQALLDLAKKKNVASESGTAFTAATTAITNAYKNVTTEGADISMKYYENLVQDLKEQLGDAGTESTILGNIEADYKEHKLTDTKKDEHSTEITELVAALDAIKANVAKNLQNYSELVEAHDALQAAWDEAFEAYNATDESAKKDTYKNTLSALRTDILDIKNELQEASKGNLYSNGANTATYTDIENKIASKQAEVESVTAYYKDKDDSTGETAYATELKAENQAQLVKLTEARDAARKTFSDDLEVLNRYLNDMPSVYNEKLIAGHDEMYALYDKITNAYNTSKAEKEKADKDVKPYDATAAIAKIKDYQAAIDDALTTAKSDANDAYSTIVKKTLTDADDAKSAIEDEIKATSPFTADDAKAGVSAAFDKDYNALKAALEDANIAINYSSKYSTLLQDLASLEDSAREKAAENHWTAAYKAVQIMYEKLKKAVDALKTTNNDEVTQLKDDFKALKLDAVKTEVESTGWLKVYEDYATLADDKLSEQEAKIEGLQKQVDGLQENYETSQENLKTLEDLVTEGNTTKENYNNWYGEYELVHYYVLDVVSEYEQTIGASQTDYKASAEQGLLIGDTYGNYKTAVNAAIEKINNLREGSTEKEYAALGDAINLLKSDFNGLSDEKKASIDYQKVQTEIDEISDTYDVLTDTMNPDKTYAKDAKYYPGKKNYEIYIDLESRVATQRAAMLGNDEKISTGKTAAQADVASLLASVKDEITNLQYAGYDLLNADYKATADKEIADYKAQLTELQTQVTAFQSGITGISDGSLLVLIENKTIADKQAELTEEYEALAKAIAESKAPYQNNLNAYNAALTKLEASAKVLNDAKTKVGDDFAGKELTRQRSTYTIADTQDAIDAQEEALKTGASTLSYKKEEPDELTVNGLKVDVIAALFIKRNEQQQLLDKLTALKSESGLYTEVASLLDPNSDYLDVTYEDLNNELTKIGKSIEASQKSINGQYADAIDEARYDEYNATKGFGETKNSVFTTFDEVKAQAATDYDAIDKALNELKSKIAANKYIVGDLDGDSEVSVNDFAQLRLVVLGLSETPEDGTSQFTLFDVNSDGRINVADLQAVVNQMKAAAQTTASKVARKVARVQNASADEVALSVSGEGINRRLAIALNNNAQYVGAQFDLVLPEGLSVDGATGTSRVAGFDVATNRLSDGTLRVLISSPEGLTIEGNAGTIVFVDLTVSPEYNGAAISIEHAIAADAKANGYDLTVAGEATGISTVTTTEYIKGKVYNVGGQLLNGLKKGVNIIRGNDGSTKKVYK